MTTFHNGCLLEYIGFCWVFEYAVIPFRFFTVDRWVFMIFFAFDKRVFSNFFYNFKLLFL